MRSNSDSATRSMLVGTYGARRPIQHSVDILVAVRCAEAFGQGDRFVDGNAIGYVLAVTQLEHTDQQDRMLDGIEQRRAPIGPGSQIRIECLAIPPDAFDELAEVLAIRPRHVLRIAELLDQVLPGALVELPAIQRLQRELARHRALIGKRAGRGLEGHRRAVVGLSWDFRGCQEGRRAMRLAISRAAAMDSPPLLPAPVAARSRACSTVSTVRTPKMMGTPLSRLASCSPRAHSPATYSKCGVSPRMTQPSATTAS